MTDSTFDAALTRLQLRYLGHEGPTPLQIAPLRLAEGLAWRLATGRADEPTDTNRWVSGPDRLVAAIGEVASVPESPEACRIGLQPARPRLAFVDRFGRRHRAPFAGEDVTAIRTLVLAMDGAGSSELALEVADGFEARGFARPLLVEAGAAMDLYVSVPAIAVSETQRAEIERRLQGFEAWVHQLFGDRARALGVRWLPVAELAQHAWAWGTPVSGGVIRPVEPTAPRREDAALARFVLTSDEVAALAPAAPETLEDAFEWPVELLEGLAPDEAIRPPAIAQRHPGLAAFFGDLDKQWSRARGDAGEFLFRVLAMLVGAYALASDVPPEQAPRALAKDASALKRAYRLWLTLAVRFATDGDFIGETRPARWFLEEGLAGFEADPSRLLTFLRAEGVLPRGERAVSRPCPAPFAPRLVSWEERRAAQAAWMEEHLAAGRPGVFVNNAEPSVSKTGAALEMMAAHPEKRFLYLAPSHALLQDVYRRAIAMGIPVHELFVAQGLERVCDAPDREETVLRDMRLGRDFKARHCRPGGTCGRQASCVWHTQKHDGKNARILLAPSAHLARENHFVFLLSSVWGNDQRDAIIIDEDPSGYMGIRRTLDPARLFALKETLDGIPGGEPYAGDLRALIAFVLDVLADPTREQATYWGGSEPDDAWRQARRVVRGRLRALAEDADEADDVPLLDAMLATGRSPGGVTIFQDGEGTAYTFRPTPALPDKPVFILDGTAVPAFYRLALRQAATPEFLLDEDSPAERSYIRPAGRLVQIVDSGNSRSKLKLERHFEKLVASVRGFVAYRRAQEAHRRCLLVTYMDQPGAPFETRFREALADLGVEVAHFGAIRGLDGYAGWDTIVVGTYRLQPGAYVDEARKTLGVEPFDTELVAATHLAPTQGASSYEVRTDRYRDEALQAVFEQKTLAELVQAIARSRVLVPGHEGAMAVVYSNFPLPGLLVEPVTMAAFDAAHAKAPLPAPPPVDEKALRTTLAALLASEPQADAPRVRQVLERRTGQRVTPSRLAKLWSGPEAPTALMRDRARHQIGRDLAAAGVSDLGEAFLLTELWAGPAARIAGPFWVETSRGVVTLQGIGLGRSGEAQVEQLVQRALKLREAQKGRRASS